MTQTSAVPDSALMILGGEEVPAAGGDWLKTPRPTTGVVLTRVPRATPDDVDAAVRRAPPSPHGAHGRPASAAGSCWRSPTGSLPRRRSSPVSGLPFAVIRQPHGRGR
jgi:hypothetical protein